MDKLLIVGAGGHGKVVADTANELGIYGEIVFLDDRYPMFPVCGFPIVGSLNSANKFIKEYNNIIVAIGNNTLRLEMLRTYIKLGYQVPTLIHPKAFISKFAEIEKGTVVFANSAINPGVRVGMGCIINTGATIDHDCILGNGVHISPGAHLAGGVLVGDLTHIGIGAAVIEQVRIGESVLLGAGSVAIGDIDSGTTVVGVPGRIIKENYIVRSGLNG